MTIADVSSDRGVCARVWRPISTFGYVTSVPAAVQRAAGLASDDDLVLVTGSLYVVGEARRGLH